jgi:Prophage minor tail protein Z (GPZ)
MKPHERARIEEFEMIKMTMDVDIDGLLRKLKSTREEAHKAIPRALNKVATTARAEAAREIKAQGYGLKVSLVKKALTIIRAHEGELFVYIRATGRPIPLMAFAARQVPSGVSVQVKYGRKVIPGAFIATMKSGHKGVFMRADGSRHMSRRARRGGPQLPIRELFGPSIPSQFGSEAIRAAIERTARERFPIVLKQELRYALSKL